MESQWYCNRGPQRYGPFSSAQLNEFPYASISEVTCLPFHRTKVLTIKYLGGKVELVATVLPNPADLDRIHAVLEQRFLSAQCDLAGCSCYRQLDPVKRCRRRISPRCLWPRGRPGRSRRAVAPIRRASPVTNRLACHDSTAAGARYLSARPITAQPFFKGQSNSNLSDRPFSSNAYSLSSFSRDPRTNHTRPAHRRQFPRAGVRQHHPGPCRNLPAAPCRTP